MNNKQEKKERKLLRQKIDKEFEGFIKGAMKMKFKKRLKLAWTILTKKGG